MASNLPLQVFSSSEIRYIESQYAAGHNGHCYDLMEKAGQAVFAQLLRYVPAPSEVWIFNGRGNNGGDGYIAAACLKMHNIPHRVFALGEPREGSEACTAFRYYQSMNGKVEFELPSPNDTPPDAIIDALLGTGIESSPREPASSWILFVNRCNCFTLAVDLPSGLNADTGEVPGECVSADVTVCMLGLKPGLLTGEGVDFAGEVVFEWLGIDAAKFYDHTKAEKLPKLPCRRRGYEDIVDELPVRVPSSNKSDSGKVLIIAGSAGMGGAAILCGEGALRSGAGLVKVALDRVNLSALNAVRPELMSVDVDDEDAVEQALDWAEVVAIGPGLGREQRTVRMLGLLNGHPTLPQVCDADALYFFKDDLLEPSVRRVITPHPGEAARLLECSPEEINRNRLEAAFELQRLFQGVVLLKGAGTVICDGKRFTIINEGSAAMATGGMGDVLTGVIAALIAQGLSVQQAAVCGACLHGRAGQMAGEEGGMIGTLPSDLLPQLRSLVNGRRFA